MSREFHVSLSELNEAFIARLRETFAENSQVTIQVVDQRETELSDRAFWEIIDNLDWEASDPEEVIQPAVERLVAGEITAIYAFEDLLAQKLRAIDTPAHTEAAYGAKERISVDGFLYVRCGVIAEGRDYYQTILDNPTEIDGALAFEPLLSIADSAYLARTGNEFNYVPTLSYETYSNEQAWSKST